MLNVVFYYTSLYVNDILRHFTSLYVISYVILRRVALHHITLHMQILMSRVSRVRACVRACARAGVWYTKHPLILYAHARCFALYVMSYVMLNVVFYYTPLYVIIRHIIRHFTSRRSTSAVWYTKHPLILYAHARCFALYVMSYVMLNVVFYYTPLYVIIRHCTTLYVIIRHIIRHFTSRRSTSAVWYTKHPLILYAHARCFAAAAAAAVAAAAAGYSAAGGLGRASSGT
jgi:hypothetical protein